MTFRVTLPCTRAEAEALCADIPQFARLEEPPVLVTSEAEGDRWRLDAYFSARPGKADLAALRALVPSAGDAAPKVETVEAADWVTLSQQGLEPIRAGRFFVHTPAHRDAVPVGAVAFEIDAGRAFGTGQHETTTGCLVALDGLKRQGASFANLVDVGTGTGLLAFAALRLWPAARAIASDVDPVAIEVAAENAAINGIRLGRARGQLELAVAAGLDDRRLKARAPYDLIIANILAGPLRQLAPALCAALAPGGAVVLSGLLRDQEHQVEDRYRAQGLAHRKALRKGPWSALILERRSKRPPRDSTV